MTNEEDDHPTRVVAASHSNNSLIGGKNAKPTNMKNLDFEESAAASKADDFARRRTMALNSNSENFS